MNPSYGKWWEEASDAAIYVNVGHCSPEYSDLSPLPLIYRGFKTRPPISPPYQKKRVSCGMVDPQHKRGFHADEITRDAMQSFICGTPYEYDSRYR